MTRDQHPPKRGGPDGSGRNVLRADHPRAVSREVVPTSASIVRRTGSDNPGQLAAIRAKSASASGAGAAYEGLEGAGDCYCFTAIERTTKLLLAWHLGRRCSEDAHEFARKLAVATAGQ